MFEEAMLYNANAGRRAWTTGLGFLGESFVVAVIVLVPILWPQAMPRPQALLMLLSPPAPVSPPAAVVVKPHATHAPISPARFTMPSAIPKTIATIVDDAPTVAGGIPGIGDPAGDPVLTAILGTPLEAVARPLPVKALDPKPPAETAAPKRIRTSTLELSRLIRRVEPAYPPLAKLAHVSGTVELTGVIGTDGHIRELKALSGNPLLIRAAIDAVSQWIYAPPVLNGERVEVIAPITVNFRLDR